MYLYQTHQKTWTHEREQLIEETRGNQYTTPDAKLKFVFEIEIKQLADLTANERGDFPLGIDGGLDNLLRNKIKDYA